MEKIKLDDEQNRNLTAVADEVHYASTDFLKLLHDVELHHLAEDEFLDKVNDINVLLDRTKHHLLKVAGSIVDRQLVEGRDAILRQKVKDAYSKGYQDGAKMVLSRTSH